MAEEFKDDEYHFSETDEMPPFDEQDESPHRVVTASGTTQLKRIILIGIAAFIVLLLLYKFLGGYFSSGKPTQTLKVAKDTPTQAKPQTEKEVSPQVTQVPQPEEPTQPVYQPTEPQRTVQTNPQVMEKLNQLESASNKSQENFQMLVQRLTEMKSTLEQTTNRLSQLNSNIMVLSQELSEQEHELTRLKTQVVRKRHTVHRVVRKPVEVYYIQALIPGRAWLKSKRGAILTVSIGDKIRGYGTIKSIDPHQGEVITSLGKVITFSPSDT